tara:strand:+ start:144 stop:380 length:237 start_codon:yes stop_codon:yes gene_type:complete
MMIDDDMKRIKGDVGPSDLEVKVEMLTKQKTYMQSKCREAGAAILDLEFEVITLKKDIDRLAEENDNLRTMMKGKSEQ